MGTPVDDRTRESHAGEAEMRLRDDIVNDVSSIGEKLRFEELNIAPVILVICAGGVISCTAPCMTIG